MTRSPRIARVLITRDVTESADIVVEVLDDESPLEAAKRQVRETDWEPDEGNFAEPYFGDPDENVSAASPQDLEFREEHLGNLGDADRQQAIAALAREIVGGDALFQAMESHSLGVAGGDVTKQGILADLERAIVNVLTRSETYRTSPAPTP